MEKFRLDLSVREPQDVRILLESAPDALEQLLLGLHALPLFSRHRGPLRLHCPRLDQLSGLLLPTEAIRQAAQALDLAIGGLDITAIQLGSAHNHLGHLAVIAPED